MQIQALPLTKEPRGHHRKRHKTNPPKDHKSSDGPENRELVTKRNQAIRLQREPRVTKSADAVKRAKPYGFSKISSISEHCITQSEGTQSLQGQSKEYDFFKFDVSSFSGDFNVAGELIITRKILKTAILPVTIVIR